MAAHEIQDFLSICTLTRPKSSGRELSRPSFSAASAVPVGHLHLRPGGPYPRGSVHVTVPPEQFGEAAAFLVVGRDGLTVAHASTGDDRAHHADHVIGSGRASRSTSRSSIERSEQDGDDDEDDNQRADAEGDVAAHLELLRGLNSLRIRNGPYHRGVPGNGKRATCCQAALPIRRRFKTPTKSCSKLT